MRKKGDEVLEILKMTRTSEIVDEETATDEDPGKYKI